MYTPFYSEILGILVLRLLKYHLDSKFPFIWTEVLGGTVRDKNKSQIHIPQSSTSFSSSLCTTNKSTMTDKGRVEGMVIRERVS